MKMFNKKNVFNWWGHLKLLLLPVLIILLYQLTGVTPLSVFGGILAWVGCLIALHAPNEDENEEEDY